jgi:hypothetical protein
LFDDSKLREKLEKQEIIDPSEFLEGSHFEDSDTNIGNSMYLTEPDQIQFLKRPMTRSQSRSK